MPEYISSDSAARHATIERFLGQTEHVLADTAVQQALGERATALLTITRELLYVLNELMGVLRKPSSVRHENAIAVTAIKPGKRI